VGLLVPKCDCQSRKTDFLTKICDTFTYPKRLLVYE
jgi:hypothetical protein